MQDHSPIVDVRSLGRRRPDGQGWLLEGISLAIRPGDRVILAGPSGAGKTLLLRAMALLDPLDAGQILWRGRAVEHDQVPAYRQHVIYLHQRAAILGRTVEEALQRPFTFRAHRHRAFDRQQAIALLRRVGRDGAFLDKTARDLSGGEIQITALLRALQLDPAVLLLDEPTAALDAATSRAAEDLLIDWVAEAADRRALVWVSHNPEQNGRVGQSSVALAGGRLQ